MLAAAKLHAALSGLGMDSSVLVRIKTGSDPSFISVRDNLTLRDWIDYKICRRRNKKLRRKYQPRPIEQVGLFSIGVGSLGNSLARQLPDADIYALHWSSELVDLKPLMAKIGQRPAFWRMADMNPMTGGCHYSMGCTGFTRTCGDCPMLEHPGPDDLSHYALTRKLETFAKVDPNRFRPVAPSLWLKKEAERSNVLKRFDTAHIPTGVNTERYRPIDKLEARQKLGLGSEDKILLFAADNVNEHRKGFDLLLEVLHKLPKDLSITPVAMGKADKQHEGIRYLGKLDGADALSTAYSAADAFVLPTRADNLPNVALEAMACELPVLSFRVGGMIDFVHDGETGFLAPPEDAGTLAEHVARVFFDDTLRMSMARKCRALMLEQFCEKQSAKRYLDLCSSLVDASRALP
ncbi:glycosyltransferase [Ruegeria hyattellae]|uniref:glycosyltransferase n=1 Tax=Ruegeria hyattellae TaxID=3233337 RepID=UPI00355C24F8